MLILYLFQILNPMIFSYSAYHFVHATSMMHIVYYWILCAYFLLIQVFVITGSLRHGVRASESARLRARCVTALCPPSRTKLLLQTWWICCGLAMSRWQTFKLAQRLLATRELRLGGSGLRPESPDHDRTVTVTHGSVMVQRSQRQVWVTREILL